MNNKTASRGAIAETKQVGKFGIVGILNTLIDFVAYNVFISVFGLPRIPANVVSATIAMTFSFIANKTFVFGSKQKHVLGQAVLFVIFTAIGLYVIQNIVIYSLTEVWHAPLNLAYDIVKAVGLDSVFSQQFVIDNGAKVIATIFSMVWNYLTYKKFVFKK